MFATIIKSVSYKSLFPIKVKQRLKIGHMGVVTAFLYCFLYKNIYVIESQLFHMKNQENKVFSIRKALYSLRQCSCVWYQTSY